MKKSKKIAGLSLLGIMAIIGTHIINRLVFYYTSIRDILAEKDSHIYAWRFGKIFYTKHGQGTPLLLIHELKHTHSSYEWKKMVDMLAQTHTVYAIDLLGCGRSEKLRMTYTNFLFVQLINDFTKDVIKGRTDIASTGASAALAVMACHMEPGLYNRLVLISPDDLKNQSRIPGRRQKALKYLIETPVIGTCIYNAAASVSTIKHDLESRFADVSKISDRDLWAFSEAAHLTGTNSKYIYASISSYYTNINILNALRQLDHSICIVNGSKTEGAKDICEQWVEINPAIEVIEIDQCGSLPQMERPEKLAEVFNIVM